MSLARPLNIRPLQFATLGVRSADQGSAARIPEANDSVNPDEIVVTARGKKPGRDRLSIGADLLARCYSIVFGKFARQVRLTCKNEVIIPVRDISVEEKGRTLLAE